MLAAIDIMIDLTELKVQALTSGTPPYKLCFLSEKENRLKSFAVIVVPQEEEAKILALLQGANPERRTSIFLLSELSQKDDITMDTSHFFAICDGGKYRYFKGGD